MKYTPRPGQDIALDLFARVPRAACFADPGVGKTSIAMTDFADKWRLGLAHQCLVLTPKGVRDTGVWSRETDKWDHLHGLKVTPITGTAGTRLQLLRDNAAVHVLNFEHIPWLLQTIGATWPYDYVIVDESHRLGAYDGTWFKGNPSKTHECWPGDLIVLVDGTEVPVTETTRKTLPLFAKVVHRVKNATTPPRKLVTPATPGLKHILDKTTYFRCLTGTPNSDRLDTLWSQVFLLDQGQRLGKTITAFRERWFHKGYDGYSWQPNPGAAESIADAIKDICLTLKAADYLTTDVSHENVVYVTGPWMAQYRELEREAFLELNGTEITAVNAAVLVNKLLQATSGALYRPDSTEWDRLHNSKIEMLKELIDEIGRPVLVQYHWQHSAQRIKSAIPQAVEFRDRDPKTVVADFAAGKIPVLLAHAASVGEGVDGLQDGTDTLIFFDPYHSLRQKEQIAARIGPVRQLQSGHPRPVTHHILVAPGTVDEVVLERWATKASIQDIIKNRMRKL